MLAILAALLVLVARFWGPGFHIWAGNRTLERLREKRRHLPSEDLILRHPEPFLYGTVAADLISFKRFGGRRNSCHNWNMAERLAPFLTTPATRAFGLGYLFKSVKIDLGFASHEKLGITSSASLVFKIR